MCEVDADDSRGVCIGRVSDDSSVSDSGGRDVAEVNESLDYARVSQCADEALELTESY